MEELVISRHKVHLLKKVREIFKNKKLMDSVIFFFILVLIGFVFYLTQTVNMTRFYAYTRLFYIAIIIAALRYDLKIAILIPTLISIGEFSNIYFSDKSDTLIDTFAISIPMYYFVTLIVSFARNQTERLRKLIKEIDQNYKEMELALISALEAKDLYTEGHSERVYRLTSQIVSKMELESSEKEEIMTAARLHDIGKIGIKDDILSKPGKLTEDEFAQIMDHPVIGYEIVRKVKNMENVAKIIKHHHERYDGKGYPDGLKGDEIPLGSRIIAVADSFDAMTSKRTYRDAFTVAQAVKELQQNSGKQFDPQIVSAFISVIEAIGIDY